MKILVDSIKEINRAWQCVVYGMGEEPSLLKDADKLLLSILNRAEREENDVEKLLDDLELKYHRIDRSVSSINVVHDIQALRTKLGLKSITNETSTLASGEKLQELEDTSDFSALTIASVSSDVSDFKSRLLKQEIAMNELLDMFIHGYFSDLVVEQASKIKAKLEDDK